METPTNRLFLIFIKFEKNNLVHCSKLHGVSSQKHSENFIVCFNAMHCTFH